MYKNVYVSKIYVYIYTYKKICACLHPPQQTNRKCVCVCAGCRVAPVQSLTDAWETPCTLLVRQPWLRHWHSLMAAGTSISVVTCRCYGHCIHIGIISTSMALPKKTTKKPTNSWAVWLTLTGNLNKLFQTLVCSFNLLLFLISHTSICFSAMIECSVLFLFFFASVPLTFLACVSSIAGQAEAEEWVNLVDASASVLARLRLAVVNVCRRETEREKGGGGWCWENDKRAADFN